MTLAPATLTKVWQPLAIGTRTAKNRMLVPARTLNWSKTGYLSDRHLAHFAELVAGGTAMIVTEQHAAFAYAKGSFHNPCTAWERGAIDGFRRFADIVHEGDALGIVQLYGSGTHDKSTLLIDEWHPLWGVSDVASIVHNETPQIVRQPEIDTIVDGFVTSARNVQEGGLDGVELHAAHGYLLAQFMSTAYNDRTDAYGGSLENRCRIVVEIAQRIREAVGPNFIIGIRISYEEYVGAAGIEPDEADEHLRLFADTGLFDYFSISCAGYHALHRGTAPMDEEDGYTRPFGKRAKKILAGRAPVFLVGRIRDLDMAESLLDDDAADMLALGRAQLADPHLIRKTQLGLIDEIQRCTGVNECIGRLFHDTEVICMMNPITGREAAWSTLPMVEPGREKRILVVGGGPAGMKTASVAARRGHRVTLVEKSDALGGHLRAYEALPHQAGWGVARDNLERQLAVAGVEVVLETDVDADYVHAGGYDEVVLAVGSSYDATGRTIWRADRSVVSSGQTDSVMGIDRAADLLRAGGGASLGPTVVIVDETGSEFPWGVAEQIAESGSKVYLVTPQMFVGEDVQNHLRMPWLLPRLKSLGVELLAQLRVDRFDDGVVTATDLWSGEPRTFDGVSTLVFSIFRHADSNLFDALEAGDVPVTRVGDCLSPRKLAALMFEGEKMGREL
ncbi:FAD-dependent oxidoreductase [Planococcus sp. APC 4015]|nr:FAD-dependent oxidoreductase [Planococcus sp. APC 4015]